MAQYKVKKNELVLAQSDVISVAAFLALSYSADVYYDGRKIVWNAKNDAALIAGQGADTLKVIEGAIGVRTASHRAASQARFIKKMQELGQTGYINKVGA